MKQQGIFFPAFGAVYLVGSLLRRRPLEPRTLIARSSAFLVGAALPFGLTCLLLGWAGVFGKFWFWTVSYARAYVSIVPLSSAASALLAQLGEQVRASTPIWILAAAGVPLAFWRNNPCGRRRLFMAAFPVFSFLAVCPGFYFREHYFVVLLPAVALLAGVAIGTLGTKGRPWLASGTFAAAALLSVLEGRVFYFELTPFEACRAVYRLNPFPEAAVVARYIDEHAPRDARIAVLGSEPEIYFLSHRRSATGYIYTFPMTERQPYAETMQVDLIREIEASRPDYLVFSPIWASDPAHMTVPRRVEEWLGGFLGRNYTQVGLADIVAPDRTDYAWGADAALRAPKSGWFLSVLKRR
jgi:hypothetical protein